MHRTQIFLEPEQYELLRRDARRRGLGLAALMRELIEARYRSGRRSARRRVSTKFIFDESVILIRFRLGSSAAPRAFGLTCLT